jgi:RNA polymerase sigma-70 factor, ECF subfamily
VGYGSHHGEITGLLGQVRQGDQEAMEKLVSLVYPSLEQAARRELRRESARTTISPRGLVHEAYLKLVRGGGLPGADRTHFLLLARRAMRQVLVEEARRRRAVKRGGGALRSVQLEDDHSAPSTRWNDLLALDEALRRLERESRRLHAVVRLRYFAGLDEEEIANVLGVSTRTVERDWARARRFLREVLLPETEVP